MGKESCCIKGCHYAEREPLRKRGAIRREVRVVIPLMVCIKKCGNLRAESTNLILDGEEIQ